MKGRTYDSLDDMFGGRPNLDVVFFLIRLQGSLGTQREDVCEKIHACLNSSLTV